MDASNRALCYFYRHPPAGSGVAPVSFRKIAALVFKKDGEHPSPAAVHKAVKEWRMEKRARGRKQGWRKTTTHEDKVIMRTFHKLRPPGHGVESRDVHQALPRALQRKLSLRTVRNRLAEKGYVPEKKQTKAELQVECKKRRVAFCEEHQHRSGESWTRFLQACGDFKDFTYYPRTMQSRFRRYRASWTYMTKEERSKPAFQKPKRMFKRKEFKNTKKGKVFGLTTSTGKHLVLHCETPFSAEKFAALVRLRVGPFLAREFPQHRAYRILLDGEPLLHAPAATEAMAAVGIHVLPRWPGYSPDLNPQENVWPWMQRQLNARGARPHSFEAFKKAVLAVGPRYPGEKLIASMAGRVWECLQRGGAMIRK